MKQASFSYNGRTVQGLVKRESEDGILLLAESIEGGFMEPPFYVKEGETFFVAHHTNQLTIEEHTCGQPHSFSQPTQPTGEAQ